MIDYDRLSYRRRQMGFSLTCVPAFLYIRYRQKLQERYAHPSVHSIHPSYKVHISAAHLACDIYVIFPLDSVKIDHDSRSSFLTEKSKRRTLFRQSTTFWHINIFFRTHAQTQNTIYSLATLHGTGRPWCTRQNRPSTWQVCDVRGEFGLETDKHCDTRQQHHIVTKSIAITVHRQKDDGVCMPIFI